MEVIQMSPPSTVMVRRTVSLFSATVFWLDVHRDLVEVRDLMQEFVFEVVCDRVPLADTQQRCNRDGDIGV
jgi:hypothetical protein